MTLKECLRIQINGCKMSLKQQAFSGMLWTSFQTFGNQIISFLVSTILARLLLPAEFGLVGMIGIFVAVGGALISSGLPNSLIRTTDPDQEDYSTVFVFNLIGSIIIYLLMFIAAPYIADFFKQPKLVAIARISTLSFIIGALSAVQVVRLHKMLDFKTETKASLVSTFLSGGIGVFFAYSGFGVMSLVYMGLSSAIINTAMLWSQSRWRPSLIFNREKFKIHFSFGSRIMLTGIIDTLFNNIYMIVIGKYFSATQLGFYSRADSIKQLPVSTFSSIFNKVTFPLFAAIKNDNVRLKVVCKQLMKMVIFIIAPILMILAVLAEPMFRFLFTEKWLPAVPYFQILCVNGVLFPLHSYNLNILSVKGRSDLILRLEVIKKTLLVVILAASFKFGMFGLLWGQVLFSSVALFINSYVSGKFISYFIWEQLQDIAPIVFLTAAMGVFVYIMDLQLLSYNDWLRLMIGGVGGSLFFIILSRILKFESNKTITDLLIPRLKNIPLIRKLK